MKTIGYKITTYFIYLIALLPFPVFYKLSDFAFFILNRVIGYRKGVVNANLKNAFPEKCQEEIDEIGRAYFKYMCDLFLETFKTLVISKAEMNKRCTMNEDSKALFERYYTENKSVIIVMGHFGNWEWGGNCFGLSCKQQLYVIYHPLSNPYFNSLICSIRNRFGNKLIAMKDTFKDMLQNKSSVTATAFIADQTPHPEAAYWTTFLNQDTPVFKGTEKIARKLNLPVVYVKVKRVGRGYYELFAETLFETPKDTLEGEITEAHTKRLERDIVEQPETWLWSHRRWKHKRPSNSVIN
jgi:KDO2-lipid IV(A) lauroyltransferase